MSYPKSMLNKTTRRIILACVTGLFFVITPALVLYTAGYRYNWKLHRLDQTGVLSIDASPKDADVYLNGSMIKETMPIRQPNLAPGTYLLEIKKHGYKTWRKDISIESSKSTYVKNITLFKENLPLPFVPDENEKIVKMWPSPDGNFIILETTSNTEKIFVLINTQTLSKINLKTPENAETKIQWSHYDHLFITQSKINNQTIVKLYEAESGAQSSEELTFQTETFDENIVWGQSIINNGVFLSAEGNIVKLTIDGSKKIGKIPTNTHWYIEEPDIIWIIDKNNKTIYNTSDQKKTTAYSGTGNIQGIIEKTQSHMIIKTDIGLTIYHLNNETTQNLFQELNTPFVLYNASTKEWLAWSPWELWTIYQNGDTTLFNRSSEYTKDIFPLDDFGVILIATENSLTAFNPGYYVSQELWHGGKIEKIAVNKSLRQIYFLGYVGKEHGIWVLNF